MTRKAGMPQLLITSAEAAKYRAKTKAQYPEMTSQEIKAVVAKKWADASDAERSVFYNEEHRLLEQYHKDVAEYAANKSNSPEYEGGSSNTTPIKNARPPLDPEADDDSKGYDEPDDDVLPTLSKKKKRPKPRKSDDDSDRLNVELDLDLEFGGSSKKKKRKKKTKKDGSRSEHNID
ncbi:hypothetical protein GGI00_004167 [Coemansia sp. RSA 2681]|nr:hypothetical protein GGI00_004167 [Coemansia sp. RSA 2681]